MALRKESTWTFGKYHGVAKNTGYGTFYERFLAGFQAGFRVEGLGLRVWAYHDLDW